MEYGKALRIVLAEQNVTQAELARRMNTSTAYVSQLCKGKIKEPTLTKALEVAAALNVSIDRFVDLMEAQS